jgi:hypothetical protein
MPSICTCYQDKQNNDKKRKTYKKAKLGQIGQKYDTDRANTIQKEIIQERNTLPKQ